MAELQFFATVEDHELIVTELISRWGVSLVVDDLPSPDPLRLVAVSEVLGLIRESKFGSRMFATSSHWGAEPLRRVETKKQDGTSRWYVHGRYGGPSLDYIANRDDLGGRSYLIPSSVATFPTYYLSTGEQKCPAELKDCFAAIRRLVLRSGKRSVAQEVGKLGPFILPGALAAYQSGLWLRVGEWHHAPAET